MKPIYEPFYKVVIYWHPVIIWWSIFKRGKYRMFLRYKDLEMSDKWAFIKAREDSNKYSKRLYKALKNK